MCQCPSWSKEPDLRSGGVFTAWVRTPPDAFFSSYILMNVYEEKIIPKDTIIYKGLQYGKNVKCQGLLSGSMFYMTNNLTVASMYSRNYLCQFKAKKDLRLFIINRSNITKLLNKGILTQNTSNRLRFVTGIDVTRRQQVEALNRLKLLFSPAERSARNAGQRFKNNTPGQRWSFGNLDAAAFRGLCKEFLTPNGYDGYYAFPKKSNFHGGEFHKEMMLCDATDKLVRVKQTNVSSRIEKNLLLTPFAGKQNIDKVIPELFRTYVSNNKIKYNGIPGAIMYLTGGMAVKVYTDSVGSKFKKDVNQSISSTKDFDFTVATNSPFVKNANTNQSINYVKNVWINYLTGFINTLNQYYNVSSRLEVIDRVKTYSPRLQNSITGRRIYQVLSFNIKTDGKTIDFVDVAVCVVPGVNDTWINKTVSNSSGFPILQHKYLMKEVASVLIRSFISSNSLNTNRNPINGSKKEKGIKDIVRASALCSISKTNVCNNLGRLVKNVQNMNKVKAVQNARKAYQIIAST